MLLSGFQMAGFAAAPIFSGSRIDGFWLFLVYWVITSMLWLFFQRGSAIQNVVFFIQLTGAGTNQREINYMFNVICDALVSQMYSHNVFHNAPNVI